MPLVGGMDSVSTEVWSRKGINNVHYFPPFPNLANIVGFSLSGFTHVQPGIQFLPFYFWQVFWLCHLSMFCITVIVVSLLPLMAVLPYPLLSLILSGRFSETISHIATSLFTSKHTRTCLRIHGVSKILLGTFLKILRRKDRFSFEGMYSNCVLETHIQMWR